MTPLDSRRRTAVALGLAALALALYVRTFGFPFIDLDDPSYVRDNPHLAGGLTGRSIAWAFGAMYASNWHPLTWISHALDVSLFGMSPGAHHAVSVLLHAAATVLLFRAFERMTGRAWPSAFVAALFAVHPLHVESVAWIAERKDVLSTVFWFATLGAYARYVEAPSVRRYAPVFAFLALGLLAKPMLVTLPATLLLLDAWPLARFAPGRARALVAEKLPLFALSAGSAVLTFAAQHASGAVRTIADVPLADRLANAPAATVLYLVKTVWPSGLSAFYPLQVGHVSYAGGVVSFAVLAAITAGLVRIRATRPYLLAGWLWYLVTLLPVIGLVQVGDQAMADRYTYVPLVGPFFAVTWLIADLARERSIPVRALAGAATLVLAVLSALTFSEVGYWRSTTTLFTRAREVSGGSNGFAEFVIGTAAQKDGRLDLAIEQYRRALALLPDHPQVLNNLGFALIETGQPQAALEPLQRALAIDPRYGGAHANLGRACEALGRLDDAIAHYRAALEANPHSAAALNNLAHALVESGRLDEGIDACRRALDANPRLGIAWVNLGAALARRGDLPHAVEAFRRAIELDPADARAFYNLGVALELAGRRAEALEAYRRSAQIDPRDPDARAKLESRVP